MRLIVALGTLVLIARAGLAEGAAPPPKEDINAQIRTEERLHSQVMHTVHYLADVYGPRLTASPNAKSAAVWALHEMTSWGLKNGHLEPWNFGHAGWTNEHAEGFVAAPYHAQLTFKVVAWTPGTNGEISGQTVVIDPPRTTTRAELARYLETVRVKVRSRIVLIGNGDPPEPDDPFPSRLDDKTLYDILHPKDLDAPRTLPDPSRLTRSQRGEQIDAFLIQAGALLRVDDAQRPHGMIIAYDNDTYEVGDALPTVVLRHEDYSRIVRVLADGGPVTLSFNIVNRLWPEGATGWNAVAEIPGTDKKDEVVIIGAHLDSWDSATGATDDAIGCAMMMEAVRILQALDVHPRRTVRIVLWTGEEQGLFGSQAYVAEHFGTAEDPKVDFSAVAAYLNIDGGTGRIRGANIFGPSKDAETIAEALAPFADLGFAGAVAHRFRKLRSTDATTFSRAGLPAIGLIQDPIEYGSVSWHSDLDTYDEVVEQDAKDASVIIAALAYNLATRPDAPARFAPMEMPKPEGPAPSLYPVRKHAY